MVARKGNIGTPSQIKADSELDPEPLKSSSLTALVKPGERYFRWKPTGKFSKINVPGFKSASPSLIISCASKLYAINLSVHKETSKYIYRIHIKMKDFIENHCRGTEEKL